MVFPSLILYVKLKNFLSFFIQKKKKRTNINLPCHTIHPRKLILKKNQVTFRYRSEKNKVKKIKIKPESYVSPMRLV